MSLSQIWLSIGLGTLFAIAVFAFYPRKSPYDKRSFIQRLFGYCSYCGKWFKVVKTDRQASSYKDEPCNWFTGCKECEQRNDEYWDAMWNDYLGVSWKKEKI